MGIRLRVTNVGEEEQSELVYEFDQELVHIGRGPAADVRLPDPTVSILHASIRLRGTRYVLIDEGSTNGTWVGERRLPAGRPHPLRQGEIVRVGIFRLSFESGVAVVESTAMERTGALARVLVRRVLSGEDTLPAPRLVFLNGAQAGRVLELPPPPARLVIGRARECDIALDDADASRRHCELLVRVDGVEVVDLGSKNGTSVDDRSVERATLRHGQQVTVGATILLFEDPAAERLDALASLAEDEPLKELPRLSLPAPDAGEDPAEASGSSVSSNVRDGAEASEPPSATGDAAPSVSPASPAASGQGGERTEEVPAADPLTVPVEPSPAAARAPGRGVETFVYVLAALVLLLGIAGLVVLFGMQ